MSLIRRLSLLRRGLAAALGLLLSVSLVGQLLPCLHADSGMVLPAVATAAVAPETGSEPAHGHSHVGPATADVPSETPSNTPAPAPHHDPAAPGCAQLMACGLAVTVASPPTVRTADSLVRDERPIGPQMQYATADVEIELPPPRG